MLTEGQAGDAPVGEDIVAQITQIEKVEAVSADKAYDSNPIREVLAKAGKEVVIPPRSNRINPAQYDKIKYKERKRIERFFNRLKQFRAAATRYDKLDTMFLGTVTVASLIISLK
ncbi:MAG: family transposase [Chthoniobacteraceae bacterium]|nr:family transposase [Chthoniobacteraceae bacterium]